MQIDDRREALELYLQKALDLGGPCRIMDIERIAMGQSRAMFRLHLSQPAGFGTESSDRTVILRVEQWGLLGSDSREEVRVMQALHAAGYPVAKVLAYEPSDELLGQPFFVMELLQGTSVFSRESLDPYIRSLHALHEIPPDSVDLDFLERPEPGCGAALAQIERWYEVYRSSMLGEPSPLLEEAAQWLRNNAPETERLCIVHGDPGPGNYLHRNGVLTGVVDWEFAHLGDPIEDWAFILVIRGAGVMTEREWVDYLRETVGVELPPERLRYWQALNLFKGACIDQTALKTLMAGHNLAPNTLAIGIPVHLSALKRLATLID